MFKLISLAALVAVATAKPSVYGEAVVPLPVHAEPLHVPAVVSTSFRKDVIHKPIVTSYTAPAVVGHRAVVEKVPLPVPVLEKSFVQPAPIVQRALVQPGLAHGYSEYVAPAHYNPLPLDPLRLAPHYRGNYLW
ncbi:uncharacterized protein LOC126264680 [Aethina tumida]|uniref:uncharacterized protein LOC126264680 n=1 Tax=Aethina tumida TaxID=116153 RepID=UPI0021485439|nr:uncharacterized protein LOC126264680 [Aethina tumida]